MLELTSVRKSMVHFFYQALNGQRRAPGRLFQRKIVTLFFASES